MHRSQVEVEVAGDDIGFETLIENKVCVRLFDREGRRFYAKNE